MRNFVVACLADLVVSPACKQAQSSSAILSAPYSVGFLVIQALESIVRYKPDATAQEPLHFQTLDIDG